jgi:sec-independent protein translocase protein TatA
MIGDLFDSPWKILIVAVVLIVLFGSAKLPGAARSLGKSMRILKSEVKDLHEGEPETGATPPAPAVAQAPAVAPAPALAQEIPVAQAAQAQLRIDDLQRQLAELTEPAVGQSSAPRTRQPG